MRRGALCALILLTSLPLVAVWPEARAVECTARTLVLSAYPSEADAVLGHVHLDDDPVVVVDGHHFYVGTIGDRPVVTAMTGIGLVNATNATEAALTGLTCESAGIDVTEIVFSGVAGGAGENLIADVVVPERWTVDAGLTWRPVDPALLEAASAVAAASPPLRSVNTAGDPLCTCIDPHLIPLVDLARQPKIIVGGEGSSADDYGGALPCIPGGGDVFGCEPCTAPDRAPLNPLATVTGALDFLLIATRAGSSAFQPSWGSYAAVDQETAAVQIVADEHGVPFIGFRGISDGPGDPLNLPGFPFQFFVYRQIAADNAATAVAAFLSA